MNFRTFIDRYPAAVKSHKTLPDQTSIGTLDTSPRPLFEDDWQDRTRIMTSSEKQYYGIATKRMPEKNKLKNMLFGLDPRFEVQTGLIIEDAAHCLVTVPYVERELFKVCREQAAKAAKIAEITSGKGCALDGRHGCALLAAARFAELNRIGIFSGFCYL